MPRSSVHPHRTGCGKAAPVVPVQRRDSGFGEGRSGHPILTARALFDLPGNERQVVPRAAGALWRLGYRIANRGPVQRICLRRRQPERAAVSLLRLAGCPCDQHGQQDGRGTRRRLPAHQFRRVGNYGTQRKRRQGFRSHAGGNPQLQVRSLMQNHCEVDPLTPAPAPADNQRKGIALITALFGVVVLGVMMSGMHFTSNQEYRGTRNALVEQRAFAIAEFGLNSEISNWDRSLNKPSVFAIGEIDSSQVWVAAGDTAWVKISRLTDNTFWVVSEGYANLGVAALEARRQTGAFVRIAYPTIEAKGAITAAGNVNLQGSALVDGDDVHPAGWTNCGLASPTVPAVVVPPTATVNDHASNYGSSPTVVKDSAAADSNTYVRYGSESWNTLTSNADIVLP